MRRFWPAAEAAQADYEALRAAALSDINAATTAWVRFRRHGLAGLIAAPVSEPLFIAVVMGVARPRWTPYADPRLESLAAGYGLLLADRPDLAQPTEVQR